MFNKNLINLVTINEADIVTHGGKFHADEVTAISVIARIKEDLKVARSFKVEEVNHLINNEDFPIVVDFGGGLYDHHQGGKCRQDGSPYASAGLVWSKFGSEYCRELGIKEELIPIVVKKVDDNIIRIIDLNDNGIGKEGKSFITDTVNSFNLIEANLDLQFQKAVEVIAIIFENLVLQVAEKISFEEELKIQIEKSKADPALKESKILWLDRFIPVFEYLFSSGEIENFNILAHPNIRGGFSAQCLSVEAGTFKNKVLFPEGWRAKSGKDLVDVAGEGSIFCHATGFMYSNSDKELLIEACKMAK